MKKYSTFLLILVLMISTKIFAQKTEQQQVAAAVESMRNAMLSGDSTSLENIADDSLTYGHSGGLVQHKPQFIHSFTSGASVFRTIDLSEQTIQVFGNTAIVRHLLTADTNDNNKPGHIKLKIITVWHKEKGKWKLIARQAVKPAE